MPGEENKGVAHCNELCTKESTGHCALCEALAERDRFIQFWFKGGWFLCGVRALRCWLYPVHNAEVRHQDVVREAHKQYSESLNKTMVALLAVALFCLLTTIGFSDKYLLGGDSTIKVSFADVPMSF